MTAAKAKMSFVFLLAMASWATAAEVWKSTFDVDADGVVDVVDGNLDKDLIGPASGGRLQITTMDRSAAHNDNDRGGRPLGATLDGNSSFGGLYRFNWSSLNLDQTQMWESVGFIGNNVNSTRQKTGVMMRHWNVDGNFFVSLDMIYGEAGTGAFLFDASGANAYGPFSATAIPLGPNPLNDDFYLAIGYDGTTHVLTAELHDDVGNLLAGNSVDLDDALVPTGTNTVQTMLDALQVTHLGWADYVAGGGDRTTVWQVDELTYYDDPTGPFNDIPAPPLGACCQLDGTCADTLEFECNFQWQGPGTDCSTTVCVAPTGACCEADGTCTDGVTLNDCDAGLGQWQGPDTLCAGVTCPDPIGACCLPDGSCDEITEADCLAQSGTWQGAGVACASVNCPQPPTGACCLLDGTCTDGETEFSCAGQWQGADTTCAGTACPAAGACCLPGGTCTDTFENECAGEFKGAGTDCATSSCAQLPSNVWCSTFDNDADGVEDVYNNNLDKDMIGPVTNGRLQITTMDRTGAFNDNDRAGRPLSTNVDGNVSYSGLYQFNWSNLNQDSEPMWEAVGFIGNNEALPNITRKIAGTMMRHWKVPGTENHFVSLDAIWGEIGRGAFLFLAGIDPAMNNNLFGPLSATAIFIGTNPTQLDFQLVISYNGDEHVLTLALFDDQGALMSGRFVDLDSALVPTGTNTVQDMLDAQDLSHLGWADYVANGDDRITEWQVDTLCYFNDAGGAFDAVVGAPLGACCQGDGTCADNRTELGCQVDGGVWQGEGSTCATSSCLGPCCLPDGTCADNQSGEACSAAGGTFQGAGAACADIECPLPPCNDPAFDADGDSDVDSADFAPFQRCITGDLDPSNDFNPVLCHCFDSDGDDDIDGDDFQAFLLCASGASVPASTACDD